VYSKRCNAGWARQTQERRERRDKRGERREERGEIREER